MGITQILTLGLAVASVELLALLVVSLVRSGAAARRRRADRRATATAPTARTTG